MRYQKSHAGGIWETIIAQVVTLAIHLHNATYILTYIL